MNPETFYENRITGLQSHLDKLLSKRKRLGLLRLLFFAAAIGAGWILLHYSWYIPVAAILFFLVLFFITVSKDLANSQDIANTKRLLQVNEQERSILAHHFTAFADAQEWLPAEHDYASDMDILGRASLFQFVNRSVSEPGMATIAEWLLEPASAIDIPLRQQAVKELAGQPGWRQQLQSFGMAKTISNKTRDNILAWISEPAQLAGKGSWQAIQFAFPILSLSLLGLQIGGVVSISQLLTALVLMLAVSFAITRKLMPAYIRLDKATAELETLSSSIGWIESAKFTAPLLIKLKSVYDTSGTPASVSIRNLRRILDRLDYRLNPVVYIPLSAFLCWDLWQVIALERWKKRQKNNISDWFSSLAALESISSLASLSFNNPAWSFPVLEEGKGILRARKLGHPLINPRQRIDNDFETAGGGKVNLVTGSNMAGKSTFLRAAGVNIILAMAGGPVCATKFSLSPMKIMSSMRISDNLEENTSTFYAELRKLKKVIDAVRRKDDVFLLLDEILRGTNSSDRHTGSAALIRQLIGQDASGILATHDLGLADLERQFPGRISNYHFDVQVAGEELYFDYKLKPGVCSSMNASMLMKKIGIEIQ